MLIITGLKQLYKLCIKKLSSAGMTRKKMSLKEPGFPAMQTTTSNISGQCSLQQNRII